MESATSSLFLGATSALQRASSLDRYRSGLLDNVEAYGEYGHGYRDQPRGGKGKEEEDGDGEDEDEDEDEEEEERIRRMIDKHMKHCYSEPDEYNEFFRELCRQSAAGSIGFNINNTNFNLQPNYFSASLDSLNLTPEGSKQLGRLERRQSFSQEQYLNNNNNNNNYNTISSKRNNFENNNQDESITADEFKRQLEFQYRLLDADRASASVSLAGLGGSGGGQLAEAEPELEELEGFGNFTREQIALNVNNGRLDDERSAASADDDERLLLSPLANSLSPSPSPRLDLNSTNLHAVMSSDCLDIVGQMNKRTLNEKAVKQNYLAASYTKDNSSSNNLQLEHQDNRRRNDKLVEHARQTGSMWLLSSWGSRDQEEFNLAREPVVRGNAHTTVNEVRPEQQQHNRLPTTSTNPFGGNHGSTSGLGGTNTGTRLAGRQVFGARCASSECNLGPTHLSSFISNPVSNHPRDGRAGFGGEEMKERGSGTNQITQPFVNIHSRPFIDAAGDFTRWSTTGRLFSNPSPYNLANQYSCYSSNNNIYNEQRGRQRQPIEWQKATSNQFQWKPSQSCNVSYLNKYGSHILLCPPEWLPIPSASQLAPLESCCSSSSSSYPIDPVPQLSNASIIAQEEWANNKQARGAENCSHLPGDFSQNSSSKLPDTFPSQNHHQGQQRAQYQNQAPSLTGLRPRCCSSMSVPCDTSPLVDGASYFNSTMKTTFEAPFHRNSPAADSNQYQWCPQMTGQVQLQLNRHRQQQLQQQQQREREQHHHNQNIYYHLQLHHHDRNESPDLIENGARGAQASSLNEPTNDPAVSNLISSPIAYDKLVAFNGNVGNQVAVAEQDWQHYQQQQEQQKRHGYRPQEQQASCSPSLAQKNRSRRHWRRHYRSQSPHHNKSNNNQNHHQQQYQQQRQQQQHRRRSRSIQLKDKPPTRFVNPTQNADSNEDNGEEEEEVSVAPDRVRGRGRVRTRSRIRVGEEEDEEEEYEDSNIGQDEDESDSGLSLVTAQAEGRLPMSVAEQMKEQASNFVNQYGGVNSGKEGGKRRANRKPNLQVRRTLRVRIKKSKPILGIAIEGGFNVSGQLLPRIVCVHEDGAAYQCGKLRASDLILEVNGTSTVNMTHDEIAKTIATAYYQDPRSHIEFLIGESIQV